MVTEIQNQPVLRQISDDSIFLGEMSEKEKRQGAAVLISSTIPGQTRELQLGPTDPEEGAVKVQLGRGGLG